MRSNGDGLGKAVAFGVPHHELEFFSLFGGGQITALGLEACRHLVEHRFVDDKVAVAGASGPEIGGFGDAGIHRGFLAVGRLVNDDGGVARAGAEGRGAGGVGGFDHRAPAGGNDEIAPLHQLLRDGDARIGDALEDIGGSAFPHQRCAHHFNAFEGDFLGAGMRGEDHHIPGLDRVNALTGRGEAGIGGRYQRSDYTDRLRIFDQALFGDFLDYTDARVAQAVTKDQLDLVALIALAHRIAQTGFGNCFIAEGSPRLEVVGGGGDRAAEAVHPCLVISSDDGGGLFGALHHFVNHLNLLLGNFFCHLNPLLLRCCFVKINKILDRSLN